MPNLDVKTAPVVDADGHVNENRVDWVERLGPDFADVAPRFLNGLHLLVEGQVLPRSQDLLGPTNDPRPKVHKSDKYWSNRPGQRDPDARLRDMDEEGIDVAFLFGTYISLTGMGGIKNPRLAAALARSYNDWLHDEFCSADPARLKAVAVLPLQDPEAAVAEIGRVAAKGVLGVHTLPQIQRTPLHDPSFDRVWAAAQDADVPMSVHIVNSYGSMGDLFPTFGQKHAFVPVDMMAAVTSFTAGGLLERFPRLKVAFFEAGVGWLPWLAARLDQHVQLLPDDFPARTRLPSEWLSSDRVFFGVEPDDPFMASAIAAYGEERFLYSSDYSHFDCECPETVEELFENEDLSPTAREKVAGANAATFFGLGALAPLARPTVAS
ncbi:MAG: putative TIM-barrel fold metal-dependent hydrolase [Acidimicrobiales bacterium]|nr:putative TIM-barrel fold metal-dependent hydrolase [Acidimicrobiales bacterium]